MMMIRRKKIRNHPNNDGECVPMGSSRVVELGINWKIDGGREGMY
jgi:hypothetical protein